MLALKNLSRRRVRTVLSILGVALGIAAIIAFNAVGRGFQGSITRYMNQSGADLLVLKGTVQDPAFSRVKREQLDFVRDLPGVAHVSPATFTLARPGSFKAARKEGRMMALLVLGRTPGDRILDKFRDGPGARVLENDRQVMLGSVAAHELGLRVGDTFELFHTRLEVVRVYDSDVPFELSSAIVDNSIVQRELNSGDSVTMGFVYLAEGADREAVRDAVEKKFEELDAIPTGQFTRYYNQLELIDWFVWIVSLVSVAVGALGVLNTMLMSVSERTREIGTLRAVGWSRGRVLRLILTEGTLISTIGGLVGLGVGTAGAELLVQWAPQGLDTEYTPLLFAQGLAVAVALGLAGALYPAIQAGRLSPIEALKYE